MPPRYAYWTILIDNQPTAFRAREREELLPTFNQLARKNSVIAMKWFARGRLWDSPEAERAAQQKPRGPFEKRNREWRPGGEHKDPRARFNKKKVHRPHRSEEPQAERTGKSEPRPFRPTPEGAPKSDRPWDKRSTPPGRGDRPWRDKKPGSPGGARPWSAGKPPGAGGGERRPWSGKPPGAGTGDRRPWSNKPPGAGGAERRPWKDKPPRGDSPWSDKPPGAGGDRPWRDKKPGGAPGARPWSSKPPGSGAPRRPWQNTPRGPRKPKPPEDK